GNTRRVTTMRKSKLHQAILDEGSACALRRLILLLGRKCFSQPDKATKQTIEAIPGLKRLGRLNDRLFEVSSWKELLGQCRGVLPRPPRSRRARNNKPERREFDLAPFAS